jgi:hypothetical protein
MPRQDYFYTAEVIHGPDIFVTTGHATTSGREDLRPGAVIGIVVRQLAERVSDPDTLEILDFSWVRLPSDLADTDPGHSAEAGQ